LSEDEKISFTDSRISQSLYDHKGQRKYLTMKERKQFLKAAKDENEAIYTFCWVLHETGCRISEALELTPERIDRSGGVIVFESLKKRRHGVYRAVPVSDDLIKQLAQNFEQGSNKPIWTWSRMTAYRYVKRVMTKAKIKGTQATAKGLRHGFAVAAIELGVPLNLVQRWLGHADMATTAIYANAVGNEERKIAKKLWR
tara:strand:- start:4578 stop:5174 length:597 start_codon:yes stop_codon:yes gene_type:complete